MLYTGFKTNGICSTVIGLNGLELNTISLSMRSLWDKFQILKLQCLWDGGSMSQLIGG